MDIDVRRLDPDMLDDYMDFFDNVAFADHPEWSQCYCLAFHFEPAWDALDADKDNPWRERAMEFVREGKIRGYLAYSEGRAVGWCNANDRKNYAALPSHVKPELWEENADERVLSAVCFLVAPFMRGKGVASKMLERVCSDAAEGGYDFVEGYPPAGECDMYAAHRGTVSIFSRAGFAVHKRLGDGCVMRKYFDRRRSNNA